MSSPANPPKIEYSDPYWYNTKLQSPFYTKTHHDFRDKVRRFVDDEMRDHISEWDESGSYPKELHRKAYEAGLYAAIWPVEFGGTPPEGFDAFHDLIFIDELARCGGGGILWAVFFSFGIALPPVLNHGTAELKARVARPVITGEAIMSLAVSEPWAGSDVANLRTTAVRRGDVYIVNGAKKWITSGTRAQFFTVAVRTGGAGAGGISLLLMEKGMKGFEARRMKTQGWWTSSTAFLTMEDVAVPVSNLIGEENRGFGYIMSNFNHERFVLAAMSNRYARVCLDEASAYAKERVTFDKRLADHQVIRHKIADMAMRVEATHALVEQCAYQMSRGVADRALGGRIALLKVQATRTFEFCAREASQTLGGASQVREGKGEVVERLYREVRTNAIGGGSEEVLLDLAMRQCKL